jgi:ribosomal protein L7/L12
VTCPSCEKPLAGTLDGRACCLHCKLSYPIAHGKPTLVTDEPTCALYLTAVGDWEINAIREVRILTGFGLVEAKALVEQARSGQRVLLLRGLSHARAEDAKAAFAAIRSTVEWQ